jgi:L-threonylcarbamoyladenylate synthase
VTAVPVPPGSSEVLGDCLAAGGVAVFPTDTVYGLCCDPENAAAVERLYSLKGRDERKPAAILCFSLAVALAVLPDGGQRTLAAIRALLPGPVTLLVANPTRCYPLAGGGDVLGLRAIEVGLSLSAPVLQSSANHSGGQDPSRLDQVPAIIRDGADLVIDGGDLPGVSSTIIDLSHFEDSGTWQVVRHGALGDADVARALDGAVDKRW